MDFYTKIRTFYLPFKQQDTVYKLVILNQSLEPMLSLIYGNPVDKQVYFQNIRTNVSSRWTIFIGPDAEYIFYKFH